jgi:hypothetical protein
MRLNFLFRFEGSLSSAKVLLLFYKLGNSSVYVFSLRFLSIIWSSDLNLGFKGWLIFLTYEALVGVLKVCS